MSQIREFGMTVLTVGSSFLQVTVRGDADEVFDGDAEGLDRCGGDSRSLVSALCRPVGQVAD